MARHRGIEPLSSDRQSEIIADILMTHKMAVRAGLEPATRWLNVVEGRTFTGH